MKYRQGWTIIELLMVLAITSLLVGMAVPPFTAMLDNYRASSKLNQIYHLFNYSRQQAVIHGQFVTVCPSRNRRQCIGDWTAPIIAFIDSNTDEEINGDDRLLRELAFAGGSQGIEFRASSRKQFLQFKASGVSNGIAGSLMICEKSHSLYKNKLVLSLTGRISLKSIDFSQSCRAP